MGYLLDQYNNESWYAEVKSAYEDAIKPEEWVVYQSAYKSKPNQQRKLRFVGSHGYMTEVIWSNI